MRKSAVFVGNCHNSGITHYLKLSKQFSETFDIQQHANWQMLKNKSTLPVESLKSADLFIFQPLAPEHGYYSTDPTVPGSIRSLTPEHCIKIAFPYTFCSSLWPIAQAAHSANRWFGFEPIKKMLDLGLTHSDIVNLYDKNEIDWEYNARFEETMKILEKKESITDIKVSSYIRQNFRIKRLFLTHQHPASLLFLEEANQVLNILGMDKLDESVVQSHNDAMIEDSTYQRHDCTFPIHKSAINDYGLEFAIEDPDAQDFYRKRLIDYLTMNPNKATAPEDWLMKDWGYLPSIVKEEENE